MDLSHPAISTRSASRSNRYPLEVAAGSERHQPVRRTVRPSRGSGFSEPERSTRKRASVDPPAASLCAAAPQRKAARAHAAREKLFPFPYEREATASRRSSAARLARRGSPGSRWFSATTRPSSSGGRRAIGGARSLRSLAEGAEADVWGARMPKRECLRARAVQSHAVVRRVAAGRSGVSRSSPGGEALAPQRYSCLSLEPRGRERSAGPQTSRIAKALSRPSSSSTNHLTTTDASRT